MESEAYIPPRFWWLKRIALTGALYLLALVGTRIWWGWEAEQRFRAVIAERRAAGEPVVLEDFVRQPIPDEQNAAHFGGAYVLTSSGSVERDASDMPYFLDGDRPRPKPIAAVASQPASTQAGPK